MGFKEKIARRKLAKILAAQMRKTLVPRLDRVKSVGVIWHPAQKEAYGQLKSQFNKDHVIFRGFCVFDDDSNPQPAGNTLTTDDLNFWGLPKPEKTDEFTNIEFDVLLDITQNRNLVLDFLVAASKAKFKVGGTTSPNNYFDLNINIGEKRDAMFLAQQQIFYLAQLNKNTD